MIQLRNVDKDNFFKVIDLWNTLDDDQKKSVAPNVMSIAQAYVNQDIAWLKAIYLEDEPIGFVMVALSDDEVKEEDQPVYFLWRFMIAKPFQGKGYGKEVLDILVNMCKENKVKYLYVSCHMHSSMPFQFYMKYGFIDTHEMDDDEEILKYKIV